MLIIPSHWSPWMWPVTGVWSASTVVPSRTRQPRVAGGSCSSCTQPVLFYRILPSHVLNFDFSKVIISIMLQGQYLFFIHEENFLGYKFQAWKHCRIWNPWALLEKWWINKKVQSNKKLIKVIPVWRSFG